MSAKAAARAAYEAYVSSEASRLNEFRRIVASRGGPPESALDLSQGSLGPLGRWLLTPPPPGPEDATKPLWAWNRADDDPYLQGSWLPEGLGAYVVAMLRERHPHLAWKLEDDRRSIHEGKPLLVGMGPVEFLPYASIKANLNDARAATPPDPDWLVKLFDSWSALAARTAGGETSPTDEDVAEDLDDVSVEPIEGDRDFNAELWISEAAETVLGREAFDGLYDRFAAIPGVERLAWEDRERFLLRLRQGTDPNDVQEAARLALREARAGSGRTR